MMSFVFFFSPANRKHIGKLMKTLQSILFVSILQSCHLFWISVTLFTVNTFLKKLPKHCKKKEKRKEKPSSLLQIPEVCCQFYRLPCLLCSSTSVKRAVGTYLSPQATAGIWCAKFASGKVTWAAQR